MVKSFLTGLSKIVLIVTLKGATNMFNINIDTIYSVGPSILFNAIFAELVEEALQNNQKLYRSVVSGKVASFEQYLIDAKEKFGKNNGMISEFAIEEGEMVNTGVFFRNNSSIICIDNKRYNGDDNDDGLFVNSNPHSS